METKTDTNTTPAKTMTLEEKQASVGAAWQKMGLAMSATDMKLQAMVQKAMAKIKIPTKTSEIIDAEKLVAELRADYNEVVNERKTVTSKLDGAITHLMKSEKLFSNSFTDLNNAILNLKKQAEQEKLKITYHTNEIKRIKEQVAIHISNHDAGCKTKILDIVDKAFTHALGNGDVKEAEVDTYISKVMKLRAGEDAFKLTKLEGMGLKYATQAEFDEIWDMMAMDVKDAMMYKQDCFDALKEKFNFYNIALKNKAESLKQAAEDRASAEAAIEKEKSDSAAANTLAAMSVSHNATPINTHKDLKKVNELEMVDGDWVTAQMIMSAFIVNLDKCKELIRVKNIWNLSIDQMAGALCKLKDKDSSFGFGSLKFKLVDKL